MFCTICRNERPETKNFNGKPYCSKCLAPPEFKVMQTSFLDGRECDLLVESIVMESNLEKMAADQFLKYRQHNAGGGMSGSETYDARKDRTRMLSIAIPHYKNNLNDTLLILNRMTELGWFTRIDQLYDKNWAVSMVNNTKWMREMTMTDTIQEGICSTALKVAKEGF